MSLFPDLWKEVSEQLLSHFEPGRFKATHRGSRWGEEYVDLADGDLLIRVQFERGRYGTLFGSRADTEWYWLDDVLEYLGLPRQPLMYAANGAESVSTLRWLIEHHGQALKRAFDRSMHLKTREFLLAARAAWFANLKAEAKRHAKDEGRR
jgi:hypothetical protein